MKAACKFGHQDSKYYAMDAEGETDQHNPRVRPPWRDLIIKSSKDIRCLFPLMEVAYKGAVIFQKVLSS